MKIDRNDLLFAAGAALVSTGAGMMHLPAGLIVGGILVIAFSLLGAMAKASRK